MLISRTSKSLFLILYPVIWSCIKWYCCYEKFGFLFNLSHWTACSHFNHQRNHHLFISKVYKSVTQELFTKKLLFYSKSNQEKKTIVRIQNTDKKIHNLWWHVCSQWKRAIAQKAFPEPLNQKYISETDIYKFTDLQITNLTIVYSTVYSSADQRKHQSSASLASVNSPHKEPVTRKMFPFDGVIMIRHWYSDLHFRLFQICISHFHGDWVTIKANI